jgi:hypothetical protein
MSHKFFCDRCEKEVKQPIDEVGVPLGGNIQIVVSTTPHYCNDCANAVTKSLFELVDVHDWLAILEEKVK